MCNWSRSDSLKQSIKTKVLLTAECFICNRFALKVSESILTKRKQLQQERRSIKKNGGQSNKREVRGKLFRLSSISTIKYYSVCQARGLLSSSQLFDFPIWLSTYIHQSSHFLSLESMRENFLRNDFLVPSCFLRFQNSRNRLGEKFCRFCASHILPKAKRCQKLLFHFILSFSTVACFQTPSISRRFPHGWKSVAVCFYYQVSWMRREKSETVWNLKGVRKFSTVMTNRFQYGWLN